MHSQNQEGKGNLMQRRSALGLGLLGLGGESKQKQHLNGVYKHQNFHHKATIEHYKKTLSISSTKHHVKQDVKSLGKQSHRLLDETAFPAAGICRGEMGFMQSKVRICAKLLH